MNDHIRPGHILHLDRAASPQFAQPIRLRVIGLRTDLNGMQPHGWVWVDGYELDPRGRARDRRCVYVNADRARKDNT